MNEQERQQYMEYYHGVPSPFRATTPKPPKKDKPKKTKKQD